MFVLTLCLVGTALALPAIPPAPILPLERDVIISGPEYLMTYGATPEFAPLRNLEFRVEPIPREEKEEYKEEKEEIESEKKEEHEFEKKDEEYKEEKEEIELQKQEETEFDKKDEEIRVEEEPKKEEEPIKPELKPETVLIQLDVPKPPSVISNWFSYLPFTLPSSITNWFSRGEKLPLAPRIVHPGAPRYSYVIVGEAKP